MTFAPASCSRCAANGPAQSEDRSTTRGAGRISFGGSCAPATRSSRSHSPEVEGVAVASAHGNPRSRARAIQAALESNDWAAVFVAKEATALEYVRKLTLNPTKISDSDVQSLRDVGWVDGEILEINQVAAYFNYANRPVLGLGINESGDILGLSPGDSTDSTNWQHQ